jgi:hypothetical protein
MFAKKILLAVIIFIQLFFTACRKGPEDPAVSLLSRKARLEGNWKLLKGEMSFTYYRSGGGAFSYKFELDQNGATVYETPTTQQLKIYSMIYSLYLKINKDGSFLLTEQVGINQLSAKGIWNFTGSVGDSKNKDGVLFKIKSVSSGSIDSHLFNTETSEFTYKLIELRNKEIKLKVGTKTYIDAQGNSDNCSGEFTLVQ